MDTLSHSGPSAGGASETEAGEALALRQAGGALPLSWPEQDITLRALWNDGKTPEEIAESLGRSVAAVMTRAARLGLPRRAAPGRKRGYKRAAKATAIEKISRKTRVLLPVETEEDIPYVQPEVKTRVCLMCLKKFQSQGCHNRICPACKGSAEYARGSSTPDFTFKVVS